MALLLASGPAGAQTLADARPGTTLERVVSRADTAMSYAVYLPPGYDSTRTWPVAFLMDPRGRAQLPLDRARGPAQRHGYVLLSSYNTLSDSTTDVNQRALNAMLLDAQRYLRIDPRRLYLVGFSGTARISWDFAAALGNAVAGIFGVGASGFNYARDAARTGERVPTPAYFGVVGETDFNYEEMQSFRPWLARQNIPHRIRSFPGAHVWAPDSLFAEAFAWFELRAQLVGLKERDDPTIAAALARDSTAAAALEAAGQLPEAWERWREIAADYGHAFAVRHADRLARNRDVQRALRLKQEQNRRFYEFHEQLSRFVMDLRKADRLPTVADAIRTLQIDRRLRSARGADRDAALAAQRELEHAYVLFTFYEPRVMVGLGKPGHAAFLRALGSAFQLPE